MGYAAAPLTLGIDRFDWRDPPLYDGGGDVAMPSFELLRDSERGVFGGSSEMLPFRLSLEPPSVSRDIMRCRRPERVLDDSSEITLALALGLNAVSSGGPAFRCLLIAVHRLAETSSGTTSSGAIIDAAVNGMFCGGGLSPRLEPRLERVRPLSMGDGPPWLEERVIATGRPNGSP